VIHDEERAMPATTLQIPSDTIPSALVAEPRWLCWRYKTQSDGKVTKVPYRARARGLPRKPDGSSTNPASWCDYQTAVAAVAANPKLDGLGFALGDGFVGVDLDHCIDSETGEVAEWAQAIVGLLDSYTEVSPSGQGLHVIVRGSVTEDRRKRVGMPGGGALEVYAHGRYFTVSGRRFGAREAVEERSAALATLVAWHLALPSKAPKEPQESSAPRVDTHTDFPRQRHGALLEHDERYKATWEHERPDLSDQSLSTYDLALCSLAAQYGWTADELAALIRTHRAEHGETEKARRVDYVQGTVAKALAGVKARPAGDHDKGGRLVPLPEGAPARPEINVSNKQPVELTDEALRVLHATNEPPELFVRAGELVRVRADEKGRPVIDTANEKIVFERLTAVADWLKTLPPRKNQPEPPTLASRPPEWLPGNVIARGRWPFPALEGIAEAPYLRPDGSVMARAGYDPITLLLYKPLPNLVVPPIPQRPTRDDVVNALMVAMEPLAEFPFIDDASRANALAMLLSPIVRPAVDGPVPLALSDAPQPGTGKSLLTEIVSIVATGREAAMISAPETEAEWAKSINAILCTGATVVVIDNVETTIFAPSLAKSISGSFSAKRQLMQDTKLTLLPQRACWFATGNNLRPRLKGALPRRCYWARQDAQMAQPWTRDSQNFRHPEIKSWTKANRGAILAALLTLARAWFEAGCPAPKAAPKLGGFEAWRRVVGGILEFAGVPDFLANLAELWAADQDVAEWEPFLRALHARRGSNPFTVADLARDLVHEQALAGVVRSAPGSAVPDEDAGTLPSLVAHVPPDLLDRDGRLNHRSLGRALARLDGTRHGSDDIRLERAGTHRLTNTVLWKVVVG